MELKIKTLKKNYGNKTVLADINLSASFGQIIAIVGENGCGKSTLFKIILGLAKPTGGEVFLPKNKKIFGMIEDPSFYNYLNAEDNLKILLDKKAVFDINSNLVTELNIDKFYNKKVKKYSKGMKQRLGLAYVLMENPDIIILDEPTNFLDPIGVESLKNLLLEEKKKGKLILISSHNLYFLDHFVDKIYFMINGVLKEKEEQIKESNLKIVNDYIFEFDNIELAMNKLTELKLEFEMISKNSCLIKNVKEDISKIVVEVANLGLKAFYKDTNLAKEYVNIIKNEE